MGEVILSTLVQVLLKKSTSYIFHQYAKMWGVDVSRGLRKIERTLINNQTFLQDAEEKQVKNEALKQWLADLKEDLKEAAYDAEDILDELNYEVVRQRGEIRDRMKRKVWDFFSFHNPIIFRIRMINKIKEIVERLDDIAESRSKFHPIEIGRVDRIPERSETHSFVIESNTIGRDEDKKRIAESLICRASRSDVSILPIFGMGGLGKTTLAQLVYNENMVTEHFERRIWVCVSEDFDRKAIVKTIIESVTEKEFEFSNMDVLQRKLREILGGKRFLLVLDDVWEEDLQKWNELKDLLTTGAEGSCIIVTTRNRTVVASIVGALNAYELKPLSEDECWSLFARQAFAEGGAKMCPNLINIGRAIVKKCGGLPLAAKMLGCLMYRKKEEWEWRSVMESEIWELENDNILPSLRLSYNYLPSHLKQCFAYCAIFPKDYQIDKKILIQLWMANGFIPFNLKEDMELKGHKIFNELASRCFFQDFQEFRNKMDISQTCRMHDLIHDLAQSIMGNECYILDKLGSISNTTLRHLSITTFNPDLSTIGKVHTFKKVRTLLMLRLSKTDLSHIKWAENKLRVLGLKGEIINDFTSSKLHLKHLRYLDLSRTNITTLPGAIFSLLNLQTLNLSETLVTTLPEAISSLLNLQTLNLSKCLKLRQLPKGIRKISSLSHLYLHGCSDLRSMPRGIGQLRCLRTLTAYPVGNEIGSGSIEELKDLCIGGSLELIGLGNVGSVAEAEAADLGSKQDLQYLSLDWSMGRERELEEGNAEEVLEALRAPQGLKFFEISHYPGKRFPTWLMCEPMLPLNLVEIIFKDCIRCEHLPQLGQLPYLEILKIWHLSSVKHMGKDDFYGSGGGGDRWDVAFPSLRTFHLGNMDNLEEWSGLEGRPSFPKLETLAICNCPKLGNFSHDSLQHLIALKKLDLLSCDGMTALPDLPQSLLELGIKRCGNISSLPEGLGRLATLTRLQIDDLRNLFSLPQGMEGLIALKKLSIVRCPNLISLPSGLQQRLPDLKDLTITGHPELVSKCQIGGEYWALISCIPNKVIE